MAKYEIDSDQFGSVLRIRGRWTNSLEKVLKEQKITQLELDYSNGWRGSDVDFLQDLPFLRSLYIRDLSGLDVSGVAFLPQLKRLHVHIWNKSSNPVLFERLVGLESCEMEWNPAFESVLKCAWLKRLVISDMKNVTYLDLETLTNLEEFWLTRASGLEKIAFSPKNRLVEVVLRKIPSLCQVVSWSFATRLSRLWLAECKRMDVSSITEAESIKKLDLFNMGQIPSLGFVKAFPLLESLRLSGSTEVRDGGLAFVAELPKLKVAIFPPKSHYDITPQEVAKLLAAR